MIDVNKNHVYIITIRYFVKDEHDLSIHEKTFTSMHGISSKKFYNWMMEKMREIPNFAFLAEEYGTQYTVPKSDFCR